MFEFRGLHPNQRGVLCIHVRIFPSLLVWSSQEAATLFLCALLTPSMLFPLLSAGPNVPGFVLCHWDDIQESFGQVRGLRFISASHPLRCCYHERIVYSFHITWLMPWWCSWASRQPVAILRQVLGRKKRKKNCPGGSFSNSSWCFSVQVSRFAFLSEPARPLQQAN